MGIDEKIILIRRNDFFALLSEEEYESLNIIHNFITVSAGEYIYFDPAHHSKLYFVKDGLVKIGTVDDKGDEILKGIINPGDIFGQLVCGANFLQGEFALAYKEDVSLCCFQIEDFERLITSKPQLGIQFAKKIAQKLVDSEYRIVNLLQKDVRTRLLYFLWTLIRHTSTTENVTVIRNSLTHDDIARLLGASRQTITRIFNELENENLVKAERRRIVIYDIGSLTQQANTGLY